MSANDSTRAPEPKRLCRLCRHCRWYSPIWTPARAQYIDWCGLRNEITRAPCRDWQRAPGADDE